MSPGEDVVTWTDVRSRGSSFSKKAVTASGTSRCNLQSYAQQLHRGPVLNGWLGMRGEENEPAKYDLVEVRIVAEDDGYVAYVPGLRGVVSQGDNMDEALEMICDALEAAVESYRAVGEDVPWNEESGDSEGEPCWIVFHGQTPRR